MTVTQIIQIMGMNVDVMIVQIMYHKPYIMGVILCGQVIGMRIVSSNGGTEKYCCGIKIQKLGALLTGLIPTFFNTLMSLGFNLGQPNWMVEISF